MVKKSPPNWAFITRSQNILLPYGNSWRDTSTQPVTKKVPLNIDEILSPRIMAYWFMDDGSKRQKGGKGFYLSTDGFKKENTFRLAENH